MIYVVMHSPTSDLTCAICQQIVASSDSRIREVGSVEGSTKLIPCEYFVMVAIYKIPAAEVILLVWPFCGASFSFSGSAHVLRDTIRVSHVADWAAIVDDISSIGPDANFGAIRGTRRCIGS